MSAGHDRKRMLLGMGLGLLLVVAALVVAALALSGVSLASDPTALARVSVQPLAGKIEHVEAFGPDGQKVPLAVQSGRLTPLKQLTPGEQVSVEVRYAGRDGSAGRWAASAPSN